VRAREISPQKAPAQSALDIARKAAEKKKSDAALPSSDEGPPDDVSASSMARGHVQEDELDRGNGVPRGMQRRCERAWPRSWCSAETIPFSIATAEAGFCELDGQRSSPRKGAHRLLGLLAMIKSRASTHSCFPVFGFLAMIKSRASIDSGEEVELPSAVTPS